MPADEPSAPDAGLAGLLGVAGSTACIHLYGGLGLQGRQRGWTSPPAEGVEDLDAGLGPVAPPHWILWQTDPRLIRQPSRHKCGM